MYESHMKNVMYLAAKAKVQLLSKHCFLPSFVNGIKNYITSSETHNRIPA